MTTPSVEVFIYSKKAKEDVGPTLRMFNGTSKAGTSPAINLVAPPSATSRGGSGSPSSLKGASTVDPDYAMLMDALSKATKGSYVIVVKDTAVSAASTQTILDVIDALIASNQQPSTSWDLAYLAKWLDRCDLYTNVRETGDNGLKLVDTVSPNGVLALMLSPAGQAKFLAKYPMTDQGDVKANPIVKQPLGKVLNESISARPDVSDASRPAALQRFTAVTTTPSLINFDITQRTNDNELLKTNECRSVPQTRPAKAAKASSDMGFLWFILIVIVVVLLAWALIRLGNWYSTPASSMMAAPSGAVTWATPLTSTVYPSV